MAPAVGMRYKRVRQDVKSGMGLFKLREKQQDFKLTTRHIRKKKNWRPEKEMVSEWGWGNQRRKGSGPEHKPVS